MASEVFIGAACGIGIGVLFGIVCCLIYVYLKKRNERLNRSRKKSFPPPGPNIIKPKIPTFTIPPIVPIPIQTPTTREEVVSHTLSPPLDACPRAFNDSRRSSVSLEDILTSVSMKDSPPVRKLSPQAISTANEPAIASLYNQQKKAISKKNNLKKSNASSVLGKLEFSLFYDQDLQELQIYIIRGINLYVPGSDGSVDLVIKAVVHFDGEEVWQDKTKPSESSSETDFSEQLIVHGLPAKKMRKGSLRLIVLDDRTGNTAGEVVYPLSNLPFNQFTTETSKISEIEEEIYGQDKQDGDTSKYLGELLISMCHNRNEKKLSITVECAQGLPDMYRRGTVDSFVKVVVMHFGRKLHSRATKVVNKNKNPDYSEAFDFAIPDDKLPQVTVYFKVKHHGKMRDTPIGMVKLGYDADREMEYRHLEQVLDKPHLSIENWHVIRKYR